MCVCVCVCVCVLIPWLYQGKNEGQGTLTVELGFPYTQQAYMSNEGGQYTPERRGEEKRGEEMREKRRGNYIM